MTAAAMDVKRVNDYEEIRPLIEMCKAGRLFEVQEWIAAGNPVNPPPIPTKGRRGKTPLEVAIELGFHSLVQVLLQAGAAFEPEGWDSPMSRALQLRRFDFVKLFVKYGFDPKSVDMKRVFDSWDPEIMSYFIDRGAEIEEGRPLAYAFCNRIRTALRVFKQYRERFPSLQEQVNIALRHHCKNGNMKWVSLMLWAGADPYTPGADEYDDERDSGDGGLSALGFAALYEHFEVFELKQLRLNPAHPSLQAILGYFSEENGCPILIRLLEAGLNPNDQDNGGCSAIQKNLEGMSFTLRHIWCRESDRKNLDTEESRARIKAIHILAKYGARWFPKDKSAINYARRSLLALQPSYTAEFVWIMSKYKACDVDSIRSLIGTPTMKSHTAAHRERIQELISKW